MTSVTLSGQFDAAIDALTSVKPDQRTWTPEEIAVLGDALRKEMEEGKREAQASSDAFWAKTIWDDAPWWAKYTATDADGRRWWYEEKPHNHPWLHEWEAPSLGLYSLADSSGDACQAWRETLLPRHTWDA